MTVHIFKTQHNKVFNRNHSAELQRIEEEIHSIQKLQALLRNDIYQIMNKVMSEVPDIGARRRFHL
jgi:hypothetical protein